MSANIISPEQEKRRDYWIDEISKLSGNFGADAAKVEEEVEEDIRLKGLEYLLGHIRLCGSIPERYSHDSSEEKLYSKYTDVILAKAYRQMGMESIVLTERADAADVECVADDFSFVADAKAFRLSRTAKNQKDFKVQAMDGWKYGKPYAMVVCPVYQLPTKKSQIYQQAAARSVCIFTYAHLAVLVRYASEGNEKSSINLLHEVFDSVECMNPSKSADDYWSTLNGIMLNHGPDVRTLWREEKLASNESIVLAKTEGLAHLARERERLLGLSKEEAIRELIVFRKIDSRERVIASVSDNGLLDTE